jgi:parvulin-like peptidyl-prolyl isomerase
MESSSFLIVGEQSISLKQALTYLQASGRMKNFIGDILRQYIIEQELQTREDIVVNQAMIDQSVIDFRLQNQLADPKQFQEWLTRNGINYESFHKQVASGFKLEKLKEVVTGSKLQQYYIERKIYLDQVIMSRIIVDTQELAEELHSQLEEGAAFDELAREYSLADDRIFNGMMGAVSRGTLPDVIRAAVDSASERQVVGPLQLEGRWCLFRVEQFLPASLEDAQLKQALQNELFDQWLAEKIQKLTIKLQAI